MRNSSNKSKKPSTKFNIKDLWELKCFRDMKVEQSKESGSIQIRQPVYTKNLFKRLEMQGSKATHTPVEVSSKLQPATNKDDPVYQTEYRSAIEGLTYLAVSTRPDIAFAVNNLACFNLDPQKEHWTALKQILRYLKYTTNIGILYKQDKCDKCIGYGDADWDCDNSDRKSTSGYIFMLVVDHSHEAAENKNVWHFPLQKPSMLYGAVQECLWLRQLEAELRCPPEGLTLIFEGNPSAIAMAKNLQFHRRAEHTHIRHHFV